ncbi:hypothetical protein K1719_007802 [Acacia pycnantha]|nr:hypothetical protein K1719_007802 [Acacia pycnantha]
MDGMDNRRIVVIIFVFAIDNLNFSRLPNFKVFYFRVAVEGFAVEVTEGQVLNSEEANRSVLSPFLNVNAHRFPSPNGNELLFF